MGTLSFLKVFRKGSRENSPDCFIQVPDLLRQVNGTLLSKHRGSQIKTLSRKLMED